MNAVTFYIGSPEWNQSLSTIRELLGDSEMPETEIRNLLAFHIPILLSKVVNIINPEIQVFDCLPTWNNKVVVKFPTEKTETIKAMIEAITAKTLDLSISLNKFNPEVCYILTREIKDGMMLITINKEIN